MNYIHTHVLYYGKTIAKGGGGGEWGGCIESQPALHGSVNPLKNRILKSLLQPGLQ
jgi:hypothetical protein